MDTGNGIDKEIEELLADVSTISGELSDKQTDAYVDHALLRYLTYVSTKEHKEGLSDKLNPQEFLLIDSVFSKRYGDEARASAMFYYQLFKYVIAELDQTLYEKFNGELKSAAKEMIEAAQNSGEVEDAELIHNVVESAKQEKPKAHEFFSHEYVDELTDKVIRIYKKRAEDSFIAYKRIESELDQLAKIEENGNLQKLNALISFANRMKGVEDFSYDVEEMKRKKEELHNKAQVCVTIYSNLENFKDSYRITPMWGKAAKVLDEIDFTKYMGEGREREQEVLDILLELYGITGIGIEKVAENFEDIKAMYLDEDVMKEEERFVKMQSNSKNAQLLLGYIAWTLPEAAKALAKDLFSFSELREVYKGIEGIAEEEVEKMRESGTERRRMLKEHRLWKEENAKELEYEIEDRGEKSCEDYKLLDCIRDVREFRQCARTALTDKKYDAEEMELLKKIGRTVYGIPGDDMIENIMNDCRDIRMAVLDRYKSTGKLFSFLFHNSPCQTVPFNDMRDLEGYMREKTPDIIIVGSEYSDQTMNARDAIETIDMYVQESPRIQKKKPALFMMLSTSPGTPSYKEMEQFCRENGYNIFPKLGAEEALRPVIEKRTNPPKPQEQP